MGIAGLFTLIEKDKECHKMIDLVHCAKLKDGLEILVDFHSFHREIVEIFTRKIEKDYDNPYLLFPSGEYDLFSQAFYEFHQSFNEANIKLVWIIDGPKGLDEIASDQKKQTWIGRDKDDIDQLTKVLEGCKKRNPLKYSRNLAPVLGYDVAIAALKDAGAEIIQLLQGGCDEFIASEFCKRNSFAIITGDTDYLIFPDCKVIFPRIMKIAYENDHLKLPFIDNENPGKIFKKPESFRCPIVSQNDLLELLELRDRSQLIILSIIKGNDNTEEYAQRLQYYLKITKNLGKHAHVTHVVDFIKRNQINQENIFERTGMNKFLADLPRLREAINFCFEFYSLKHFKENSAESLILFDPTITDNSLTGYFREKMSKSEISKKVYSLHWGIWHDLILAELPYPSCPHIAIIMAEIQTQIYPYVLKEEINEVLEWRPRSDPIEFKVTVQHSNFKTNKIHGKVDPESDDSNSENNGIELFEKIWSHLEPEESLEYVRTFGLERGFICYILRYFYKITKDKNLRISQNEFKSLFLTVFYHYSLSKKIELNTNLRRDSFLKMRIYPMERCLMICAWFMNIYFMGKYLCGGAFNLTGDFPMPAQLMSGSVLFAFYENTMNETNERLTHLEDSILDSIEDLGTMIIKKYSSEYEAVTK